LYIYKIPTSAKIQLFTPVTIEILSKLFALNQIFQKPAKITELLRLTGLNSSALNSHISTLCTIKLIDDKKKGRYRYLQITDQGKKLIKMLPNNLTNAKNYLDNISNVHSIFKLHST
jgi:predicted transcriptional regulator